MSTRLRWGILGTGNIARQFATGVGTCQRGVLSAAGSRQFDSARAFAAGYKIPTAYGDYDAVLRDANVDVVYNSLPNHLHHEWTIKALKAGKHVLCEKPIAINAAQAEEMFDVAQRSGRVLVEAFMYRSHPQTLAVAKAIQSGAIGQVRLIRSSFCYYTTHIDGNIRFSAAMAGGALMDIGSYCINFSRYFAQAEPTSAYATGHLHENGIDDYAVGALQFPRDIVASFTCGMRVHADNTAYLCGTEGYIEIPIPWKPPAQNATFIISRNAPPKMDNPSQPAPPPRQTITVSAGLDLYGVEADDIAATILDSAAPRLTRQDTVGNMRVLDQLRGQLGVVVPKH